MQSPLQRLSFTAPSFDWLAGVTGRRFLLYSVYSVGMFAIFLLVNFPHQVVVQRALSKADLGALRVDVRSTRFAWWRGWELQNIVLREVGRPTPLLEIPSMYVRPTLKGVLSGTPSTLQLDGQMYGGSIEGSWSNSKEMSRAAVRFDRLMVGRYPQLATLLDEGQVAGAISGAVSFENRRGDRRAGRAAGDFELRGVSLTEAVVQGFTVPDLHFENATLKFTLQGGQLEIEEFVANGEELEVRGGGQVAVRDPLPDSALNLRVKVVPGSNSPDSVKALLGFLPQPPKARPDAPFSISGTIAKPRLR